MTKSERHQKWKEILADQVESGMNKSAYCSSKGIAPAKFYYWQRRLGMTEEPAGFTQVVIEPRYSVWVEVEGQRIRLESERIDDLGQIIKSLLRA